MMQRAVVLRVPDWSVVAAIQAGECAPDSPVAMMEKGVVRECSARARDAGIRPGMRRREAHAICPEALLLPHQDSRDTGAFNAVLVWLSQWVPQHFHVAPGIVALGARGVARFYGGETAAAEFLRELGKAYTPPLDIRVGIADDLFTAVTAAAQCTEYLPIARVVPGASREFLADMPIQVLGDDDVVLLLMTLGIHRVGDFVALDENAIRERFGVPGERLYQLATGSRSTGWVARDAPVDPEESIELAEPQHLVDQISFAIRARTDEYYSRLIKAGVVCTRVAITIVFDDGHEYERVWVHPRFFSSAELVDRVRWQLEHHGRDNAEDVEYPPGVLIVRYLALDPETASVHEPGLWGQGPDARVHQVFSRIQGLLGSHGVLMARSATARMPSDSHILTAWGDDATPGDEVSPLPGALPKPLPATIFQGARLITLHDHDGNVVRIVGTELSADPVSMQWRDHQRRVQSWAGPWPIYEKWWDSARSRLLYRLQALDEYGMGWLLSADVNSQWRIEARYD